VNRIAQRQLPGPLISDLVARDRDRWKRRGPDASTAISSGPGCHSLAVIRGGPGGGTPRVTTSSPLPAESELEMRPWYNDHDYRTFQMKKMAAGSFKVNCLAVMDEVQAKRETVVITKRGKPVAKLVPADNDSDDICDFLAARVRLPAMSFPLRLGVKSGGPMILVDTHVVVWLALDQLSCPRTHQRPSTMRVTRGSTGRGFDGNSTKEGPARRPPRHHDCWHRARSPRHAQ
jgi:antitoxin (DNA-binding transcriptional repressor) of toxin-antitoxin stability system